MLDEKAWLTINVPIHPNDVQWDWGQGSVENFQNQLSEYDNEEGHTYTVDIGENFVARTTNIDFSKTTTLIKERIGYDTHWLYKDVIIDLESKGFTCK